MMRIRPAITALVGITALAGLPACESLPGSRTQQSTAAGTAVGAVTGAVVAGEGNRLLGALLGGAVGAAGGYLIGAKTDWFERDDGDEAAYRAIDRAERNPATVADVRDSTTADLNDDGFVTQDELLAMERAGLSDREILERLRATGEVFDLSAQQREDLLRAGVSRDVVDAMPGINQDARRRVLSQREVLGQEPTR
jgi:hypothetical protein